MSAASLLFLAAPAAWFVLAAADAACPSDDPGTTLYIYIYIYILYYVIFYYIIFYYIKYMCYIYIYIYTYTYAYIYIGCHASNGRGLAPEATTGYRRRR